MKIGFYTPQLDIRGTCNALFNYAHYNETLLNNSSIIFIPKKSLYNECAYFKFKKRFNLIFFENNKDLENKLTLHGCQMLYCIKYGTLSQDNTISTSIKTVIHCVFDMTEPHGNVYAGVSKTLANKFNSNTFVPHIVGLKPSITKNNLKKYLNIPNQAVVFGRHGGRDTFDIQFVKETIIQSVNDFGNIYFIFVNTPLFYTHPKIIHIDKIVDDDEKNRFIHTCDAMIHAQTLGETFGLSIGEFSINNKPIITYNGSMLNTAHKDILGNKAIYYDTPCNLYEAITTFVPSEWETKDNNAYKHYTPDKVMKQFEDTFINSND
jgi:hypothetical protein